MAADRPLVILLNGPLGIGKSTLGEVLGEAIDRCVTLDGDRLSAINPPPADELASLHDTVALLAGHHLKAGYDRFVINHYWADARQIAALVSKLRAIMPDAQVRRFLLRTIRLSQVMIACRDSVPVGYAALHNGWLDQLYIHPDHHRLGIGTALLAWARRDAPGLRLYCFAHNARARAFYGSHGGRILSEGDGSDNEEGLPDLLIGFPET